MGFGVGLGREFVVGWSGEGIVCWDGGIVVLVVFLWGLGGVVEVW